jgi:hypothetical protein
MMMFVSHPVAGVHRVPANWMDGLWPSGFREATPAEVVRWHEDRDLDPPADVLAHLASLAPPARRDEPPPALVSFPAAF